MGYLNKICKFISRLFTIWKLNQHPTGGKIPFVPLQRTSFSIVISTNKYFTISISGGIKIRRFPIYSNLWLRDQRLLLFHHSNFTISNSGGIKIRRFPIYSNLWLGVMFPRLVTNGQCYNQISIIDFRFHGPKLHA